MKTEHKIYAALAILALLGLGFYLNAQKQKKHLTDHSATAATADLPAIGVSKDDVEKVVKLEIKNADKSSVTLEKKGETWEVTAPVAAKANAANVRSLLDNLKELKVKEVIDRTTGTYGQYELTDEKAVHVTATKEGGAKVADLYFGKSGSRGQMMRTGDKEGVYVAAGYSSYLYTREVKNWRETSILKFEDANVVQASIENKHGLYSFSKNGDAWAGSFTKRGKEDKLEKKAEKWEKFDEAKVKDMLRAYKGLNAEDFADEKAETGLDNAVQNGGVVKITLKDNAGEHTIKVGKTAKGSSRYAVKEGGDPTVYVLSSWSADWATAEKTKFEKAEGKKDDKPKDDDHGGEEGLEMPQMPME